VYQQDHRWQGYRRYYAVFHEVVFMSSARRIFAVRSSTLTVSAGVCNNQKQLILLDRLGFYNELGQDSCSVCHVFCLCGPKTVDRAILATVDKVSWRGDAVSGEGKVKKKVKK